METPNTKEGEVTEEIMFLFWKSPQRPVEVNTAQYNTIYAHVLKTLEKHYGGINGEAAATRS